MVGHGLTRAGLWCPGGAWSLMYRDAGSCTHIRAHMSRRVDICAQKRTYRCLGQLRTIHTPTPPHPHTSTHVMTCLHARACVHMYARATRGVVEPRWVCARARAREMSGLSMLCAANSESGQVHTGHTWMIYPTSVPTSVPRCPLCPTVHQSSRFLLHPACGQAVSLADTDKSGQSGVAV